MCAKKTVQVLRDSMRKRGPSVDWQIAENEAEWERLQAVVLPERAPVPHRRRLQRYCWSAGILLLLLVGVGDWRSRTTADPGTGTSGGGTRRPAGTPDGASAPGSLDWGYHAL